MLFPGKCPKCTTGSIYVDLVDKDFWCLNCGYRATVSSVVDDTPRYCSGSGDRMIVGSGSFRNRRQVTRGVRYVARQLRGRCATCYRVADARMDGVIANHYAPATDRRLTSKHDR